MQLSPTETQRYQKHLRLPQIGLEGQLLLKNAKVLVVGAGGLGCPVLLYLAAAGVGNLGIIDPDRVDLTNLQRQVLYGTQDLAMPKAIAAVRHLQNLNPEIEHTAFEEKLTRNNAIEIIQQFDLVIDCTDNFEVRYIINDACVRLDRPFVYGAIHQFEGQVSVFNHQQGPTYRCIFPEKPSEFEIPNCATVGVLGVLPGIIGSLQANEAIKIITKIGNVLSGELLMMDLLENTQRKIRFKRKPEAVALALQTWPTTNTSKTSTMNTINANQLSLLINKQATLFLLDVRELDEYQLCSLPNAHLISMNSIPQQLDKVPRDIPVVVYCHHGVRSASVIRFMEEHGGFQNLKNLTGGIHAWAQAIDPSMTQY